MDLEAFQRLFFASLRKKEVATPLEALGLSTLFAASFEMERYPIQDASRYRSRFVAQHVAQFLLDEAGELQRAHLAALRLQIERAPFLLAPHLEGEAPFLSHLLHCLRFLEENRSLAECLKRFSVPLCHKRAEEIVRETLWPNGPIKIQTPDVRRAVLTAWLTPLRQAIGSCFATAPAILVQRDNPLLFFQDLSDLLSKGQLRRVCQGRENSVPLSPSSGMGDLLAPVLPFESLDMFAAAPGLFIALDDAGVLSEGLDFAEKRDLLRKWLHAIEGPFPNYESLLRHLLLYSVGLTEADIEEEEHFKKAQMTAFFARKGEIFHERLTERGEKVASFKARFSKAKIAFRSMTECALLRSWEYTLASFCDVKLEFTRWNLFLGLGLHPDHKGGIGPFLFGVVDSKLQATNARAIGAQREYEQSLAHVRALESILQTASSEGHRFQIKGELTGALHTMNAALELRDRAAAEAEALAQSFVRLIEQIDERLQEDFQEVFDPLVKLEQTALYNDSPAGFRLVYKHGRRDASLWTMIYSEKEYLQALREFFVSIEGGLVLPSPLGKEFIAEVISLILRFIEEKGFLRAALERTRQQGRLAPWEYVSGGTMQTLVQNYWNLASLPTESQCTPQSEKSLYVFLQEFAKKTKQTPLMHSPTHAFIFYPQWMQTPNFEAIRSKIAEWSLNVEMREWVIEQIAKRLPAAQRALFLHLSRSRLSLGEVALFREHLLDCLRQLQPNYAVQTVDSVLYEYFGALSISEAKEALQQLLKPFLNGTFSMKWQGSFFRPKELLLKAKEVILEKTGEVFSKTDWDLELVKRMRSLGYCYPEPVFFGDSNWSGWRLGWIVNVATGDLELWRLNRTGLVGFPMTEWSAYVSSSNESPWVVLSKPMEYNAQIIKSEVGLR